MLQLRLKSDRHVLRRPGCTEEDLTADEDEFWRMCEERQAEQQAEQQAEKELMRMRR